MALEAQSIDGVYMSKETASLMRSITEQATMEKTTLNVANRPDQVIVARLKHLGYTVEEHDSQRDGYSCTISW